MVSRDLLNAEISRMLWQNASVVEHPSFPSKVHLSDLIQHGTIHNKYIFHDPKVLPLPASHSNAWNTVAHDSFIPGSDFNCIFNPLIKITTIFSASSLVSFTCLCPCSNEICGWRCICSFYCLIKWMRLFGSTISIAKLLRLSAGRAEQRQGWDPKYRILTSSIQIQAQPHREDTWLTNLGPIQTQYRLISIIRHRANVKRS